MSNKKIKAVLFDLDGTLCHFAPSGEKVFTDYLKSINVHFSEEDDLRSARWVHFYFANALEIQADKKKYTINAKDFWVNFSRRRLVSLGLGNQQAEELAPEVSAHMGANYKPETRISPNVHPTLTHLKDAGYKLGVVSNRDEPLTKDLQELKLDRYFDFSLAGGEIQSFKPDLRIFQRGLELAGSAAHETMYIGDNYFADIRGSLRAGLVPVLYDPSGLFPDSESAVIRSFDELRNMLI